MLASNRDRAAAARGCQTPQCRRQPPVKMTPPARPRREGATCESTVGAARTIRTPPAKPEARRQAKNQANETGNAQAKNATDASSIIVRIKEAAELSLSMGCASKAPAK